MTREEAIAIIRKEYLCVDRDCDIEKSCGKCDLMMPSKEPILQAYRMAIQALEQEPCDVAISKQAVLDFIKKVCFSREQEWVDFRVSQGSNGQRDLIINFIEDLPPVTPTCEEREKQDELIRRQAVLDLAKKGVLVSNGNYESVCKAINELPSVNPTKTGHWIMHEKHRECSKCNVYLPKDMPRNSYCPNCGAIMVEPQKSDHKCHTCKHYTIGERDGSCGSYICKGYSNWESEEE